MAFLRTFSALIVAGLIWIGLFVELDQSARPAWNALAAWISPLSVLGWVFYLVLTVGCFLLALRFIGHASPSHED